MALFPSSNIDNDDETQQREAREREELMKPLWPDVLLMLRRVAWGREDADGKRRCALCQKSALEAGERHAKNCQLAGLLSRIDDIAIAVREKTVRAGHVPRETARDGRKGATIEQVIGLVENCLQTKKAPLRP